MTEPDVEVLTASRPRDLLAAVPHLLGFQPVESLVVLCLGPDGRRLGPTMRLDLPPDGTRKPIVAAVHTMEPALARVRASRVFVLLYSDRDLAGEVLDAVTPLLDRLGLRLEDAWHIGRGVYRSLTCEQSCCPPEGMPLADLDASLLRAELVYRGEAVLADRAELLGDLSPLPPSVRAEVEKAAHAAWLRPAGGSLGRRAAAAAALSGWRRALAAWPEVPEPATAGVLLAALDDVVVRDAIMMTAVPGCGDVAERLAVRDVDGDVQRALAAMFGPVAGRPRWVVRPDRDLADAVAGLLRHLVRAAENHRRAAPLAAWAWLAWWTGNGALAADLVDRALDADPGYSLARLLETAVHGPLPPPWVDPAFAS